MLSNTYLEMKVYLRYQIIGYLCFYFLHHLHYLHLLFILLTLIFYIFNKLLSR